MSKEIKISNILLRASEVVISRDGDTSGSDGDFACVDIDSIIHLESEISKFFDLDSDNVIRSDLPLIKTRSEKYDRLVEENNRLREALKATIKSSWGVINSDDEDFLEKVDLHKNLEGELSRAEELLSEIGGDL